MQLPYFSWQNVKKFFFNIWFCFDVSRAFAVAEDITEVSSTSRRQGTWADSELEKALKSVLSFARSHASKYSLRVNQCQKHLSTRLFWQNCCFYQDFKTKLKCTTFSLFKWDHLLTYIKVLSVASKAWSNINCRCDLDRGVKIYMYSWIFVVDRDLVQYGQTHIEIMDKMKKEFKVRRSFPHRFQFCRIS